jgi:hypothetical protein
MEAVLGALPLKDFGKHFDWLENLTEPPQNLLKPQTPAPFLPQMDPVSGRRSGSYRCAVTVL